MTREQKISFIIKAIQEVEGVVVKSSEFEHMSDEEINEEADWYDYLLGK
ncbi:hypothetical protein F6Y03_30855 [Bacillus megaterium]|jgi:hypothetical protein|nr:hypothetical protein [Priestia megaterium]